MPFAYLLSTSETKNNAHANQEFVAPTIIELLENAKSVPCKHKLYRVNPLTVIENKTKQRLVLGLQKVNPCLVKHYMKFEGFYLCFHYTSPICHYKKLMVFIYLVT